MTEPSGKTPVPGSERLALDRPPIGDVPGSEVVDAMVTLRTDIDDERLNRVVQFLEDHGLTVANTYQQTKTLHVRGPAAGMQSAFSVKLARYFGESGDQFRGRSGPIYVPDDIAADVTAVLGLDDRNTARPWHAIAPRAGGSAPLTPLQVAKAYQFPTGDGQGQTVGIIELGGAFTQKDLDSYLASLMVPAVAVTVVPVMGATPTSDGPNGADGEVMLDVEIIAALAPGANVRVYFGPNTTAGFLAAINQAIVDGANVISISWGGPESTWTHQAMNAYDQTFAAALTGGCSVFAASGRQRVLRWGPQGRQARRLPRVVTARHRLRRHAADGRRRRGPWQLRWCGTTTPPRQPAAEDSPPSSESPTIRRRCRGPSAAFRMWPAMPIRSRATRYASMDRISSSAARLRLHR